MFSKSVLFWAAKALSLCCRVCGGIMVILAALDAHRSDLLLEVIGALALAASAEALARCFDALGRMTEDAPSV